MIIRWLALTKTEDIHHHKSNGMDLMEFVSNYSELYYPYTQYKYISLGEYWIILYSCDLDMYYLSKFITSLI